MKSSSRSPRHRYRLTTLAVALLGIAGPAVLGLHSQDAAACGGQCQSICIDPGHNCNNGFHYSWQQARCVENNNAGAGICDDGYRCDFGNCGGAGERFCNTAGTGCSACFPGYFKDEGAINQYGSYNIDGEVFCGATVACQPACQGAVNIPDPDDITFYVTGEMEFGRTLGAPPSLPFHDRHVRILNQAGDGTHHWPAGASGGPEPLRPPVAVVGSGDLAYTDQGGSTDVTKCERLAELKKRYDYDPLRRRDPDTNLLFPFLPGLGNHDLSKPGTHASPVGTHGYNDQNFIMTKYLDSRLLNAGGGRCMGVANYDGPETKQAADYGEYGWKSHNYSWDWGQVHIIQGNAWAGYLTQGNLDWLKDDLKNNVGNSGRPVIYIQHFGWRGGSMEPVWWNDRDRHTLFAVLDDYNVIALIHGHNDPDLGSAYTIKDGDHNSYQVFEVPSSGKGDNYGGFLAVRLRPTVADFSFYRYSTRNNDINSIDPEPGQGPEFTQPFKYSYACKDPVSGDWAITRQTGIRAGGFRACQNDPAVPQGYVFAAPVNANEQAALDAAGRGNAVVWTNFGNAPLPRYWAPGEPNGNRNENCVEANGNAVWNDRDCNAQQRYACKTEGNGVQWGLTQQVGIHSNGAEACQAELGFGAHFTAPVNSAENAALAARLQGSSAWINLTDQRVEGTFIPLPGNLMQRASAHQIDSYNNHDYTAAEALDSSLATFTHTTNTNARPWIEIDLGGLKYLEPDGITVWNRRDCCGQRLSDFYVVTSETPFGPYDGQYPLSANSPVANFIYHHAGIPGARGVVIPTGLDEGNRQSWTGRARYVRVQLDRQDYLSVAGIEVRGRSVCGVGTCSPAHELVHYTMTEVAPRNHSHWAPARDQGDADGLWTAPSGFGRLGGSYHFDGVHSAMTATGGGRFDSPSGSMMAFIYPEWAPASLPGTAQIVGIRDGSSSTRLSVHVTSDYGYIVVWNGTYGIYFPVYQLPGKPVRQGAWCHVALNYDSALNGGTFQLYLNGALVQSQGGLPGSTQGLGLSIGWVGASGNAKERFQGYIDEVRVFDAPVTDTEVAGFATPSL